MGSTECDDTIDLSNASFDEFVRFWFDRAIDPRAVGPQRNPDFAWYQNVEIHFEPRLYAENFVRLFNAPEFLLNGYSKDQLEGPLCNDVAHGPGRTRRSGLVGASFAGRARACGQLDV
jgi:hypothetical protein